jgi:multicomponent Na+:H+ antiporter subunit E
MTLLLWIVYLAITANLEITNLVAGLLIGLAISLLIRPRGLEIGWRRVPGAVWSAVKYLFILIYDMLKSGVAVGRLILNPRLPIDPGIVVIDAGSHSELSTALSAHAMTLTPGELVIEMNDQGQLFTHCLEAGKSAEYVVEAQKLRKELLSNIFD